MVISTNQKSEFTGFFNLIKSMVPMINVLSQLTQKVGTMFAECQVYTYVLCVLSPGGRLWRHCHCPHLFGVTVTVHVRIFVRIVTVPHVTVRISVSGAHLGNPLGIYSILHTHIT